MTADDEALARLRAADPARDPETDLASLRRGVELRLGDELPGDETARATGVVAADGDSREPAGERADRPETERDELAERRARRGRRRAWIAGAAASVLVGLAGYGLGAGSGGGSSGSDAGGSAADMPAEEQADGAYSQQEGALDPGLSSAGDPDSTSASGGDQGVMAGSSERAVFTASGLSDQSGTAEAFGYDGAAVDPEAAVAELAQSLGIAGGVTGDASYASVAGDDGRTVEVVGDAVASVTYYDLSHDPWACGSGDGSDPEASCDAGSAVSDAAASVATDFLRTIGVDVDGLTVVVASSEGGLDQVTASVPGVETPEWNVMVASGVVYQAWGARAARVSLGDYDTISATAAVERLMDPRFEGATTYPADGPSIDSGPTTPTTIEPGAPFAWPVTSYTIDDAELGLAQYWLDDGSAVLLPTWSLTDSGAGRTWTVVAVADTALAFDAD